jgi:hypothetical protein
MVAGRHWPGAVVLSEQARQGCQSRLSGYLNPRLDPGGMVEYYVYPIPGPRTPDIERYFM